MTLRFRMFGLHPQRRAGAALALSAVVVVGFVVPPAARGQDEAPEAPDVATLERELEDMFEAVVEMSDEEPAQVFAAWGMVISSAVMLERRRSMESADEPPPKPDFQEVREKILQRWERRRPDSAGPALFRTFDIQDPAAKRDAVVAVADRHPDDALALWHVSQTLRQARDPARAVERAEAFVARNPERSIGYRVLAQHVGRNETQRAEVLQRWAAAMPGDPALVRAWLASPLVDQDPELTHRILNDFFEDPPMDSAGLEACLQVLRRGDTAFTDRARVCVARVATEPGQPESLTQRATTALAETAAAEGDWESFVDGLESLDPEGRIRALIATAHRLDAPERCAQIVELLTVAAEEMTRHGGDHWSLTSAMDECSERADARALYLNLLSRAPPDRVRTVLTGWVANINGRWRGELPPQTLEVLERRLEKEGAAEVSEQLFEALDIVYRLEGREDRRFDLLTRWHRTDPSGFDEARAIDLALGLVERNRPDEAVGVLERQMESRFGIEVVETLWGLYMETGSESRAVDLIRSLIGSGEEWQESVGHLLAARSAVVGQDLAAAERHYLQALAGERPRQEVAVEFLAVLGSTEGAGRVESLAERICRTSFPRVSTSPEACAADLLTKAGQGDAAGDFLASQAENLPDDVSSLREIASTARAAGRPEVAETALRRILELDPRNEGSWTDLGVFLERQGRASEVEALVVQSREVFSTPPTFLYRAAGRALTTAGQPERAIELLLEARAEIPADEGGEWSRGAIQQELREAYKALGQALAATVSSNRPPPIPAFGTTEVTVPDVSASELRRLAESLQTGSEGRYDPRAARVLFSRAAAKGDLPASFRLALLQRLAPERLEVETEELYRRSAEAVRAAAREGDAYAAYLMGTAALVGLGQPVDDRSARRWLEQAAAGDEPWAWHNLAWMDATGRGRQGPDVRQAVASYRRASLAGNVVSMVSLARLIVTWDAPKPLCEEGLEWLNRSARAGNAQAAAYLGKLLFYGLGECVARDAEAAVPWLEAGAATHQPEAGFDLGLALVLEAESEDDRRRGLTLLQQAAQEPSPLAMEILAFLHASGIGTEPDPAEAERHLANAVSHGSDGFPRLKTAATQSEAIRDLIRRGIPRLAELADRDPWTAAFLARLHQVHLAPEPDPRRAVELARRAAAAGQPRAMRVLMHAYGMGEGVEKNEAESLRWTRRGAEAGDTFCMMFLGHHLLKGEKVDRDLEAGLAWLHRAAEAGNRWAMTDLAHYFDEGVHGVPRDPLKAAAWHRRLAQLGDPEALGWLRVHGSR